MEFVQKADDDDHTRRCRYNAAGMTWKEEEKGTRFKDLPDVYVVYIAEHDFLHGGRTVYHLSFNPVCTRNSAARGAG